MNLGEIMGVVCGAGGIGTAVLVGLGKAWSRYQARKERERLAEIDAEKNESERDARTEERLWERLDDCEKKHEECDERVTKLEQAVQRSTADITGRIDLAAERLAARRSPPPPPARQLPPPRKRKETDDD